MDFSGELATIQQRLARCQDIVARRCAALEALEPGRGERIVEVGCGPGLYVREIALAVGAAGSVLGIDVSADQIAAAQAHCADLSHARLDVADVRALPCADGEADAVLSVQVLEYVQDVDAAVAEIARVTRRGGRFVNLATNWDALFWSGGDPDLTRRVLAAWDAHAPHPNLPVTLPGVLRAHGFDGIHQRPLPMVNRRLHENSFAWWGSQLIAAFVVGSGALTADEVDAWRASLIAADDAGRHFLSSVPVITLATLG